MQGAAAHDERQRLAEFRSGNLGCVTGRGRSPRIDSSSEARSSARSRCSKDLDERTPDRRRRPGRPSVDPAARSVPAAYRRAGSRREPLPPTDRRSRRAGRRATLSAAPPGTGRPGRATAPSDRAPLRAPDRRPRARVARADSAARPARNESSRVGSPLGCVAAIGRTGRMPYGRQSSRSKRTGPAAIGAAVARRMAVTASANSPGASGGSVAPGSSARSSSSTLRRSGSRPKSVGRSPFASGHSFASSPVPAARMRMPLPSSIVAPPVVIPITGAMAPYW